MKRMTVISLVLALAFGAVAAPKADAGWFRKDKSNRTEKPEWMKKARRYNELPAMSFHSGVLQQDGRTGWKLGESKLQFAADCLVTLDGAEGASPEAGRRAVVMGPHVGDTIVAWTVRIAAPTTNADTKYDSNVEIRSSVSNPNCGEIVRAPQ